MRANRIRLTLWALGGILLVALGILVANREKPAPPPLPELERSQLVLTNGVLFRIDEQAPFTGWLVERYEGGAPKARSAVRDGRLNGVSEGWHTNGVLQVREHFKDGVSHGLREKWRDSGAKESEAMIASGKLNGLFRRWHENGQLAEQLELKDDEPHGAAVSFYESGFLKVEAQLEQGKVMAQTNWNDGEKRLALDRTATP